MVAFYTQSGNLVAGAATVTFLSRYNYVQVENNDGTNGLYVTTNWATPSLGGVDCFLIPPNTSSLIPNQAGYWYQGFGAFDGTQNNPGTVIKMISSSATAAYNVSGAG